MAVYSLSCIFKPQYVSAAAGPLVFAPGAAVAVPPGYNYQIAVCRVANTTGAPVSLEVWRVPQGATADNQHIVLPPINVPVATQTFPYFDLTALWGIVLAVGDSISAVAGSDGSLVVHADGAIIQI